VEQGRGIFGEVAHAEGDECFRMHRIGDLIAVREGRNERGRKVLERRGKEIQKIQKIQKSSRYTRDKVS
jgi:hypothetical protein